MKTGPRLAAGMILAAVSVSPLFAAAERKPVTSAEVRPPASALVDCTRAPKDAVTKLPEDLARWATVYCTKFGHVFNANDRFFGVFPDSGIRASIGAAEMDGKSGEPGNEAYFTAIAYRKLTDDDRAALINLDPTVKRIYEGKTLWRLDLSANGGKSLSFLVISPERDPFWVFPMESKGIGSPAFYVTSLDLLNKGR
jgi:hypothetical protein